MAEGRMLKKAISTSRRLADLKTDSARMLYTWIIPHLDIEGRFYADPALIKGSVVPRIKTFTEEKINSCLDDLNSVGLIVLYVVDGDRYLSLRKFKNHQSLRLKKEAASIIPHPQVPDKAGPTTGQVPDKAGSSTAQDKIREEKIREEKGVRKHTPPSPVKMKFLDSVFLSAVEHQKLTEAIGQKILEIGIEQLDYSITVKGGKYKDHYKTILNWHKRGFLKGNGSRPTIQPGERDVPLYVGDPMPEISDEQRRANLEKIKQFTAGVG